MSNPNQNTHQQVHYVQAPIYQPIPVPPTTTPPPKKKVKVAISSIQKVKKPRTRNINATVDYDREAQELITEIRDDLKKLIRLNKVLVHSDNLNIGYTDRTEEYKKNLSEVNKLSKETATKVVVAELEIIKNKLSLDLISIDSIAHEIVNSSIYVSDIMQSELDEIDYPNLKKDAESKYKLLLIEEEKLDLDDLQKKDNSEDSENNFVNALIQTISTSDKISFLSNKIVALKHEDKDRKRRIQNYVLTGMAITILFFAIGLFILYKMGVTWNDIRGYPLLGIPLGVALWSFIGSFAAMLQQFYQKPIYEFGNPLKWIIIRPVLGVLMGSAIYLAFSNGFGINVNVGNGGLSYMVAFFVGLSDSFSIEIINRIQGVLENSVKAPEEGVQTAATTVPYVVTTQPTAPITTVAPPPVTTVPPPVTPTPSAAENTTDIVDTNARDVAPNTSTGNNTPSTNSTSSNEGMLNDKSSISTTFPTSLGGEDE